jgi:hypothetical protein
MEPQIKKPAQKSFRCEGFGSGLIAARRLAVFGFRMFREGGFVKGPDLMRRAFRDYPAIARKIY